MGSSRVPYYRRAPANIQGSTSILRALCTRFKGSWVWYAYVEQGFVVQVCVLGHESEDPGRVHTIPEGTYSQLKYETMEASLTDSMQVLAEATYGLEGLALSACKPAH